MILAEQGKYDQAAAHYSRLLVAWPSAAFAPALRKQLRQWRASGVIAQSRAEGSLAETLLLFTPSEP